MKNLAQKFLLIFSEDNFQIAVTFLVGGFLSGASFTWLTRLPALENFFFEPRIKFPVARLSWWAAFSLCSILGIIIGFLVSRRRVNFVPAFDLTVSRQIMATTILISAVPISMGASNVIFSLSHNLALLLILPLVFLTVVSFALCFATRSFKPLPIALILNLIFICVGFAAHALLLKLLNERNEFVYEFVQWTFLFAALSFSSGVWLLFSFGRNKRKDV